MHLINRGQNLQGLIGIIRLKHLVARITEHVCADKPHQGLVFDNEDDLLRRYIYSGFYEVVRIKPIIRSIVAATCLSSTAPHFPDTDCQKVELEAPESRGGGHGPFVIRNFHRVVTQLSKNGRLSRSRRSTLRHEGAAVEHIYLLTEGWIASSMTLKNGARQFFKVHIPGDIIGAPSVASVSAVETLTAITDCTVKCIPLHRLGAIFDEHPRIGMSLFLSANKERIALMDMLAAVGRMSAVGRLARFLVDLHARLRAAGQTHESHLPMPMTREEIADLLGLTAVHVNRMLHELEEQSLLSRNGRDFILDLAGLQAMKLITSRTYVQEPPWLPPVRI